MYAGPELCTPVLLHCSANLNKAFSPWPVGPSTAAAAMSCDEDEFLSEWKAQEAAESPDDAESPEPVEDHRLTRADGRQKVSLTVVLGMILRLIGTNPPQEPLSAVFWLWKLS